MLLPVFVNAPLVPVGKCCCRRRPRCLRRNGGSSLRHRSRRRMRCRSSSYSSSCRTQLLPTSTTSSNSSSSRASSSSRVRSTTPCPHSPRSCTRTVPACQWQHHIRMVPPSYRCSLGPVYQWLCHQVW